MEKPQKNRIKPLLSRKFCHYFSMSNFHSLNISKKDTRRFIKKGIAHSKSISSLTLEIEKDRRLRKLVKFLQFQPLKKFSYSSFWTSNQQMSMLSALFKKMSFRNLNFLEFSFAETEMAGDKHLKPIAKTIRQLSNLKTLNFLVYNFYCVRGLFLTPLKETLRQLKNLENLRLQIELCDMMKDEGLDMLLKSFKGLSSSKLSTLFLNLGRVRKDLSNFLPAFAKQLKEIHSLKTLYLNIVEDPIDNEGLESFCGHLAGLKSLENLGMCMYPQREEESSIIFKALANMPWLRGLEFKFSEVTKDNVLQLSRSISQMTSLRSIKLYFSYSEQEEEKAENIEEEQEQGQEDEEEEGGGEEEINKEEWEEEEEEEEGFELDMRQDFEQEDLGLEQLEGQEMEDIGQEQEQFEDGIQELGGELGPENDQGFEEERMERLRQEEEKLKRKINDEALVSLFESLKTHCNKLEVVHLMFLPIFGEVANKAITLESINHFTEFLLGCTRLRDLKIYMLNEFDQQNLTRLADAVQRMTNLEILFLKLNGKEDIGDNFLKHFAHSLSNKQLQNLDLFLGNLEQVTDEGTANISQAFLQLHHLQRLKMGLSNFPKLTKRTLHHVTEALKQVKPLEEALLGFTLAKKTGIFSCPKGLGKMKVNKKIEVLNSVDFIDVVMHRF